MDFSKINPNQKIDTSDKFAPRSVIFRIILGFLMGSSDAIPGYSGGTTLSISNYYDKMMLTAKNILKPEAGNSRKDCFVWIIPFAIGWLSSIVGISVLLKYMLHHWNMQAEVLIFFSLLCILNVPNFILINRLKLSKEPAKRKSSLWSLVAGILIIVVLGVLSRLQGGIDFGTTEKAEAWNWGKHTYLLMIGGFIGGFIMLIPGGSGSLFIFLIGLYDVLHSTVLAHVFSHIPQASIFFVCVFAGMSASVFFSSFLLKKYKDEFSFVSLGMILTSGFIIMIVVKWNAYDHLKDNIHVIGCAISGGAAGLLSAGIWFRAKHNQEKMLKALPKNIKK